MAVYLSRQSRYDVSEIRRHLEDALDAIDEQPRGERALIKPNLVNQYGHVQHTTTHASVVEAVHDALRDRGFRQIVIADGPSINRPVDEVFANSGMAALALRLGVELIDLNQAERRSIPWRYGELALPNVVLDADYYVNVPKMKTHVRCGVTLSLKNQQGICDYDEKRNNHKRGVDEPLGELGKMLKPNLVVLDGVEGMEGNGPTHGKPNAPGIFAAGTDAVEFDGVVAQVMGFSPEEVPIIAYATTDVREPQVRGQSIEQIRTPFLRPNAGEYDRMLGMRVWSNVRSCNGCDLHATMAKESLKSNPKMMFKYGPALFRRMFFGRIDVLKGEGSKVPADHGSLVFVGDCTADLAAEHAGRFVPGCPPDPEDILDALAHAGAME